MFRCGRDNASTEGLRQYEGLSRFGRAVGGDVLLRRSAGDRKAVLRFRIVDGVATHNGATGLSHDREATLDHLAEHVEWNSVAGPPDQLKRCEWISSHRVDIAQRVRRGDPAPVVRVIDDRREKVNGLDDDVAISNSKNPGVI
jgi:hypothetical protein